MHKNGVLPFVNPATGERFGEILMATPEEIARAHAEMRQSLPIWRAKTPRERAQIVKQLQKVLVQYADEIARTMNQDTGKSMQEGVGEVLLVADKLHNYCKEAPKWLAREAIPRGLYFFRRYYTEPQPFGVVLVIGPWNLPLDLTMPAVIAALLAGNTVLLKPSEVAPATGMLVEKLFQSVPALSPYVRVLHGDASVGAELVRSRPDLIFLTGSRATGKKVAKAAAETLTPFICELGGKDPMIVLEDADIEAAARWGVWGAFFHAGQTCVSVERIYVVEQVYDAFLQAFLERTRDLKLGFSPEAVSHFDLGPVTFDRQIHIIEDQLADAREKGAEILLGGRRKGHFVEPTVVVNVDHSMKLMQEETFGPIAPIMKVRDEAEAIALANDSEYGLSACVWSRDIARAQRVAAQLEVGSSIINDTLAHYAVPLLAFGGVKGSGTARTHGKQDVLQFTQSRAHAVGSIPVPLDVSVQLRTPGRYHLVSAMLHLFFGVTPRQRLRAVSDAGSYVRAKARTPKPGRLALGAGTTTLMAAAAAMVTLGLLRRRER